jgi:hypothetical protein
MNKQSYILKKFEIDPLLIFWGTPEEQEKIEQEEQKRANYIKSLILSNNFRLASFNNNLGTYLLTYSTRQDIKYQLSFLDRSGRPTSHENYINLKDSESRQARDFDSLLNFFINVNYSQSITLDIYNI